MDQSRDKDEDKALAQGSTMPTTQKGEGSSTPIYQSDWLIH